MRKILNYFLLYLFTISIDQQAIAQTKNPLSLEDSLFVENDSIAAERSSLELGVSFSSQALAAGRNFGVSQFSIIPSIAYYHKSGLYGSIEGSILGSVSPPYNCTSLSIGYSDSVVTNWNYTLSYAHQFFMPDTAGLIQNMLSGSISYAPAHYNLSFAYAYLFGEEKAHQLVAGINAILTKDFIKTVDNINCSPGAFFTLGTANIPFTRFTSAQFQKGNSTSWQQWKAQRVRQRAGQGNSSQHLVFGLMNIDLVIPLTITIKNFQLGVSYNYSIPFKLSEENSSEIQATGYLGASILYTIQ